MSKKLIHNGIEYECEYAVKCTLDKYIKLYDAGYNEIASFHGITNFSDFTLEGAWNEPCAIPIPMSLSPYILQGSTINASDWIKSDSGFYFDIENVMISGNKKTCNIMLNFAAGTEIEYIAEQSTGKIRLIVDKRPNDSIVIDSMIMFRTL